MRMNVGESALISALQPCAAMHSLETVCCLCDLD